MPKKQNVSNKQRDYFLKGIPVYARVRLGDKAVSLWFDREYLVRMAEGFLRANRETDGAETVELTILPGNPDKRQVTLTRKAKKACELKS